MRVFTLLLLWPSFVLSQSTIDAEQFFAIGLSKFERLGSGIHEEVKFSWVDKYELRTETRDFDLDQQEYSFRLSPSTRKIRNAQKAYYQDLRDAPDFKEQETYCEYLLSLQSDWLALYMIEEHMKALHELSLIMDDKKTIYDRMAGSYDFDVEKLLKVQTEKNDLQIAMNELETKQDYLLSKYNIQNQGIDFGEFIAIEDVTLFLSSSISPTPSEMVDLQTEYEKQLLNREIELESSEKDRLIDFVQLKYNGPHSDLLQERVSLGLGFQLSTAGSDKLKMQELQIKQDKLARESKRNMEEKQAKVIALEKKIKSDIEAFSYRTKNLEEEKLQLQDLTNRVTQKEGTSPLFLLDIEERRLSMQIKSLDDKEELLEKYLRYLHQSGKMCHSTFVNYLSR